MQTTITPLAKGAGNIESQMLEMNALWPGGRGRLRLLVDIVGGVEFFASWQAVSPLASVISGVGFQVFDSVITETGWYDFDLPPGLFILRAQEAGPGQSIYVREAFIVHYD